MRTRAFALVAFGVSLFAACEEGDIAASGSGAAAGTSGTAGKGGASGSAGKGGASGSAGKGGQTGGSAGSNATGGGSGEAGSGEAGAGGTVGEAGSAGSSASGAAGEAGAPGAGAPGAGGTNGPGNDLCEMGCMATLAADCPQGPNSMRMCVSDCRDLLDGFCSEEYEALRTCAVGEEVTCGQMGFPIVEACSDEQSEFRDCMN